MSHVISLCVHSTLSDLILKYLSSYIGKNGGENGSSGVGSATRLCYFLILGFLKATDLICLYFLVVFCCVAVVVYLFMYLIGFFTNIPHKGTMRVDEIR